MKIKLKNGFSFNEIRNSDANCPESIYQEVSKSLQIQIGLLVILWFEKEIYTKTAYLFLRLKFEFYPIKNSGKASNIWM